MLGPVILPILSHKFFGGGFVSPAWQQIDRNGWACVRLSQKMTYHLFLSYLYHLYADDVQLYYSFKAHLSIQASETLVLSLTQLCLWSAIQKNLLETTSFNWEISPNSKDFCLELSWS